MGEVQNYSREIKCSLSNERWINFVTRVETKDECHANGPKESDLMLHLQAYVTNLGLL